MGDSKPRSPNSSRVPVANPELLAILGLTLIGLLVRCWMIGSKGLWYDEAATALMARAAPLDIIWFHWNAAFEHPPAWVLLMHYWSKIFAQSEAALRIPAAMAGAATVPLIWLTARTAWPRAPLTRLVAAALVAFSPALILYAQEARMYSLVALLGVVSVYLAMRLLARPGLGVLLGFVLTNWVMLGLHYYSALLIGVEGLYLLVVAGRERRSLAKVMLALAVSLAPLALWAAFAPAFRDTLGVVSRTAVRSAVGWVAALTGVWRDLSFGSVRWQPALARVGYLLLPLLFVGIYRALRPVSIQGETALGPGRINWGILFVLIVIIPVLASLAFLGGIATRYVLWVSPFVYVLVALGIGYLWRLRRWPGLAGMLIAAVVAVVGIQYYFANYQKSEYREMAEFLNARAAAEDAVILEAPRQHLLTKYYLPSAEALYPMPPIQLPDFWPATAPAVVPEEVDHQLVAILEQHPKAWLILAGEDEVDPGEFVERYLRAVSYPQDCQRWLDVRLCAFLAPQHIPSPASVPLQVAFEGGMELRGVTIGSSASGPGIRHLYASPQWHAGEKPGVDYAVTLRLLNGDGAVVSQDDGMPIGPLLPATTWNAGDDKPGHMVLDIPDSVSPGEYDLVIGLYDPASLQLMSFTGAPMPDPPLLKLATIEVDSARGMSVGR
jgi:mannosyltransferase